MATRRDFLKAGLAAGGALTWFGRMNALAATSANYRALVCVFLFGGNDSNNMVVPLDSGPLASYAKIRGTLALSPSTLSPFATSRGAAYGLHAQLKDLASLYQDKKLAIVANTGTLVAPLTRTDYLASKGAVPSNLFSHSDQQAEWQTSSAGSMATTGWGGRAADQVAYLNSSASFPTVVSVTGNAIFTVGSATRPAAVTPGAPLGLRGYSTSLASAARMNALEQLLSLDGGSTLVSQAAGIMAEGLKDSAALNKAVTGAPALTTKFPSTTLGSQLQQVAKIIQVRDLMGLNRQVFFCSLGGFDTHTNQLADQDRLLGQLGPALAAFYSATVEMGVAEGVTTFTESDFSRTMQPNTNGGTDHAWGAHHFVLGGAVNGGDLYGKFPDVTLGGADDAGAEGRWIPTTSINQYGATLAAWFGVPNQRLGDVFPNIGNFQNKTLAFL